MKFLRVATSVLILFWLAYANHAHSYDGTATNGESTEVRAVSWVGKSGNKYNHRIDRLDRMLSMKRENSSGYEIEFKYEGNSNRPIAARLAGRGQWRTIHASNRNTLDGECAVAGRKELPATAKAGLRRTPYLVPIPNAPFSKAIIGPSPTNSFKLRAIVGEDGELGISQAYLDTIDDLRIFAEDFVDLTWADFDLTKDKPRCEWQCDWIYDFAMIGCTAMMVDPPAGLTCVVVMTGIKWTCKYYCDK